jgi:ATP-dependent RNA helicase RhlE
MKVSSFADLNLSPALMAALELMKIETPTPIQSEATPVALSGADMIGVAQTGSGKTLAYALAVMTHLSTKPDARALILLPSRETAEQVSRVFEALGKELPIAQVLATAGVPGGPLSSALKKLPPLIIATPGRLGEQLQTNKLLLKGLDLLVIDEADRMLDLGFEPQLKFIQSTLRGERQTLMFAASFGPKAQPVANLFLRPDPVMVRSAAAETPVETLTQTVYFLKESQKENRLRDEVKRMKGGVIIFAESQESCVAVGRFLEHHEFKSEFVHGDMNSGHRTRVLREFREERFQILITTDLLARGLDVPHVQHVINYELPYKAEDFLHRIGRTARAGRDGSAITFITPADGRTYRKIKQYLTNAEEKTIATDFKFDDRISKSEKPSQKNTGGSHE